MLTADRDQVLQHLGVCVFQQFRVDDHFAAFLVACHGDFDRATACCCGDCLIGKFGLLFFHLLLQFLKLLHHSALSATHCGGSTINPFAIITPIFFVNQ